MLLQAHQVLSLPSDEEEETRSSNELSGPASLATREGGGAAAATDGPGCGVAERLGTSLQDLRRKRMGRERGSRRGGGSVRGRAAKEDGASAGDGLYDMSAKSSESWNSEVER